MAWLFRKKGGKDEESKATRAHMGEESTMYFDKEKGRWRERGKEHLEEEEKELAPPPMAGAKKAEPEASTEDSSSGTGGDGPPKPGGPPAKPVSAAEAMMAPPNPYRHLGKKPATAAKPMAVPGFPGAPFPAMAAAPAPAKDGDDASGEGGDTAGDEPKAPPMAAASPFGGAQAAFGAPVAASAVAANPNAPRAFPGAAGATPQRNPNAPRGPGEKRERPKARPVPSRGSPFGKGPAYVPPTSFGGDPEGGGDAPSMPPGVLPPGVKPPKPPEPETPAQVSEEPEDASKEPEEASKEAEEVSADPEVSPPKPEATEAAPADPEGFIDPEGPVTEPPSTAMDNSAAAEPASTPELPADPEGASPADPEGASLEPEAPKADVDETPSEPVAKDLGPPAVGSPVKVGTRVGQIVQEDGSDLPFKVQFDDGSADWVTGESIEVTGPPSATPEESKPEEPSVTAEVEKPEEPAVTAEAERVDEAEVVAESEQSAAEPEATDLAEAVGEKVSDYNAIVEDKVNEFAAAMEDKVVGAIEVEETPEAKDVAAAPESDAAEPGEVAEEPEEGEIVEESPAAPVVPEAVAEDAEPPKDVPETLQTMADDFDSLKTEDYTCNTAAAAPEVAEAPEAKPEIEAEPVPEIFPVKPVDEMGESVAPAMSSSWGDVGDLVGSTEKKEDAAKDADGWDDFDMDDDDLMTASEPQATAPAVPSAPTPEVVQEEPTPDTAVAEADVGKDAWDFDLAMEDSVMEPSKEADPEPAEDEAPAPVSQPAVGEENGESTSSWVMLNEQQPEQPGGGDTSADSPQEVTPTSASQPPQVSAEPVAPEVTAEEETPVVSRELEPEPVSAVEADAAVAEVVESISEVENLVAEVSAPGPETAALQHELATLREAAAALQRKLSESEAEMDKLRNRNAELEQNLKESQQASDEQAKRLELATEKHKAAEEMVDRLSKEKDIAATRADAQSPAPMDDDGFELPDFVWSCGNSQVMEYVQKLVSDNAALRRKQASDLVQPVGEVLGEQDSTSVPSAVFDAREASAESALKFLSTISENDGHQIPSLVTLLSEHSGDVHVCSQVCAALENMTFTDSENRRTIVLNNGVEAVLGMMKQHQEVDAALLRPAVDALWNITFEDEAVDRVTATDGIERILAVMRKHDGAPELQAGACAVLLNLAVKEQNRWKIVQIGGVGLVATAMQRHSQCEEVLEQGCQALYMLAYHQDLRPLVLAAKGGDAAMLAASYPHGAGRAQKWGRWLQEVLAC